MAVLALAVVGAEIGGAVLGTGVVFAGLTGSAIGWSAGALLGSALFAPHQRAEGPRIGDLSVQASTYGTAIPILFGSMRAAGNVIFCTDKREVKTEQEQGGKGSGPTVTTTTYKYNVDMAVALCEGPIVGIRKVWANGKLIYDLSTDADVGSVVQSKLNAQGFKVYLGDESQLPDPTIEATKGAGNVPGYRGIAYVVFDHLDCPNGVVPQLSFEIVVAGSGNDANPIFSQADGTTSPPTLATIIDNKAYQFPAATGNRAITRLGPGFAEVHGYAAFTIGDYSEFAPVPCQGGDYAVCYSFSGASYLSATLTVTARKLGDSATTAAGPILSYVPGTSANSLRPRFAAFDSVTEKFCAVGGIDGNDRTSYITIMPGGALTDALFSDNTPMAFYDDVIYTCGVSAGITYLNSYDGSSGALIDSITAGANYGDTQLFPCANEHGVYVLEAANGTSISVSHNVWKVSAADGWVLLSSTAHFDNLEGWVRTWWSNDDYGIVGPSGVTAGQVDYRIIRYRTVDTVEVAVADVIDALCDRAGLDASQYDTSDLTATLHGYAITRVAGARESIAPLMRAYFIDAPESDGAIKFIQRAGKSTVATIPFDDLGAIEPGSDAADPLPLVRVQEAELPRSVALSFINKDADYQTGTETARRQVTSSIFDATDSFPIAAGAGQFASVANVLLYDAWQQRTTRKTTLPRAYARLDAGDNVSVEYPRGAYSNKRIVKTTDTGQLLEVALVDSDPDVYTVTVAGASPAAAQTVEYFGPTKMLLLDIPLLRDADNASGLYGVFGGYATGWPGATISADDASGNYTLLGGISTSATTGSAITALGDWTANLIDETNTVDVQLAATATLSSTTRDTMLDTDANACLIGDEILQFRTATSLGSGQWRLSGLRRGRRGTEWATSTHAIGDQFVLLLSTAGMLRLPMDLADIGRARNYKAVSIGQTDSDATVTAFECADVGLKPLAPANFDIAQDAATVSLRWVRRSRLRDNWLAGTVPLGEASESYEVDVIPPGGATITYSATSRTLSIDAGPYVASGLTGRGALFAINTGGYVYTVNEGGAVYKLDETDLSVVASTDVGGLATFGLVMSGSDLFGISMSYNGGNGRLCKLDTDVNVLGAVSFPLTADGFSEGHGIVVCAGSLWVALAYSSVVRRYDPATLLPVADVVLAAASSLATDGTYVYALARGGSVLNKIDPGTNAIVSSFAIAGPTWSDLQVANGYAFLMGGGDGKLRIYRLSDGQQMTHTLSVTSAAMSTSGNYVGACYFNGASDVGVTVIDATTLTARGAFPLVSVLGIGGFAATVLDADRVIASTDYGYPADYYDRTALGAGTQFNLYQVSADVGRGFAASRTL